ncbi:TlpA disulfide reductase family protein [Blastopirellula marina]|nr:TlpA disulfide reductase family protein [Blastopirellula marina]
MSTLLKPLRALLCFAIFASSSVTLYAADAPSLTIGSQAPALGIEHWLSAAQGERGEVKEFESEKIYVVEFWATWCIPCVASMPHLADLQTKYADQQVQIISVSQEPLETVTTFLDRQVLGDDAKRTYAQLTAEYSLTTDPDSSVFTAYMQGAGQKVIPTAFVVGKTGQIEWIGHPKDLDQPLAAVVADNWDRDKFRQSWEAEQQRKALEEKLKRLVRDGELPQALLLVDDQYDAAAAARAAMKESLKLLNLATIAQSGDKEATIAIMEELLAQCQDDPQRVVPLSNQLRSVHRSVPIPAAILAGVVELLEQQMESETGEAKKSATVSLALLYMTTGDKDKAIETLRPLQAAEPTKDDQP